jgi:hypothetical protein
MNALIRYDTMCRAIDAAYRVDEVKDIRDKASALEHYARQAKNIEAERQACEIRLRAERKCGQLLKKTVKRGQPSKKESYPRDSLKQNGISHVQSSQWQKLGAVSQAEFDSALAQAEKPTTKGIIKATSEPKVNPVAEDALWLWGRLNDFERNGMLQKNPSDVMRTMTPEMKDGVHTLAPRVAAWLKKIGSATVAHPFPCRCPMCRETETLLREFATFILTRAENVSVKRGLCHAEWKVLRAKTMEMLGIKWKRPGAASARKRG